MAANLDQCDRFLVSGLETNGCASGNVQSIAVGFDPVEIELWVRLDEMIVRTNLDQYIPSSMLHTITVIIFACPPV